MGVFWELIYLVLETHMNMCVTEQDFLGKTFLPKTLGKRTKDGPKIGFFEFLLKIWSVIFTEFVL